MNNYYCQHDNCSVYATHGYDEGINLFCGLHKSEDMILTFQQKHILELDDYEVKLHRKCHFIGCDKRASFNFPNEKLRICCKKHCFHGMINVMNVKCKFENCKKQPIYNFENERRPIYCGEHKEINMIDIKNKKCKFEGCTKQPTYNFQNEKRALYCKEHKEIGMIDVLNKRCKFENCMTRPNYNFEYEKTAIYCSIHKVDGMINILKKLCEFSGCDKKPHFNFENEVNPVFCSQHKKLGMINIKSIKCLFENCTIIASYNFEGLKPVYCVSHKNEGMIDVISKKCNNSWCNTQVKDKYEGYCLRCFIHKFPDQEITRNFKVKERYVTDYLKEQFSNYDIVFDKTPGACSKRRPDAYIDLETHVIIIECDENQHQDYDTTCEIARINELFTDFADRPIIFIRFNPDKYDNVQSSFKYHKQTGAPIIRDEIEWNCRLEKLKETIQKYISIIPDETKFEYLFYDS